MTASPAVSIVMRSFNESWAISDTIRQIYAQDFTGEIELIVIDSGSSDGSIEIIKQSPAKLIQIPLGTYVPGVVLNQGAAAASHDWIVYLNADATPVDDQWLTQLVTPCISLAHFGAGFSRQIPRPDCQAVFAADYDRCFGPDRESAKWEHFFSMVSSITHRSVLEKHPFREDLQHAEDDEWTRRLRSAGLEIPYFLSSVVMHSHNYTLAQSYKRAFGDAKAMAATNSSPPTTHLVLGTLVDTLRDAKWCLGHGKITQLPHAAATRFYQRLGRHAGFKKGRIHYSKS